MAIQNKRADFFEIDIEDFLNMTGPLAFDIYIQLGTDKIMKIFNANDIADHDRLRNYVKKGVKALFLHNKDRDEFNRTTEELIKGIMRSKDPSHEELIRALIELTEQTIYDIQSDKVFDDAKLKQSLEIAKNCIRKLHNEDALMRSLVKLCRTELYSIKHSLSTGILSVHLAQDLGKTDETFLENLCLAGFLHDMGLSELPVAIADADHQLSDKELKSLRTHTDLSLNILNDSALKTEDLSKAIEQHHEYYDGTGYPIGLKGDEISEAARILTLIDCYTSLTVHNQSGETLISTKETVTVMNNHKNRFDPTILEAFSNLIKTA